MVDINLFLEHLSRLDNVHQWEERDSIIKESVSQHSFKVSAIAYYILRKFRTKVYNDQEISISKFNDFSLGCLSYAILHDFDEAILGRDISHVVKYNSYNGDKIRAAINDFVEHQETAEFKGLLPVPTVVVKKFVKVCDWIALHTFCYRNEAVGCISFKKESAYVEDKLSKAIEEFEDIFNTLYKVKFSLKEILCQEN